MRGRVFVAAYLIASTALAQPPIEAVPPGEDKIVVIKEGEKAPYSGQLFDPPTAIRWANWLEQYRLRLKMDVAYEQERCSVQTEYDAKVLKIEKKRAEVTEEDLRARLIRAEQARLNAEDAIRNPSWYRSPWFTFGLGFVGAAAAVGISAWALNTAK